jgi:tetratricopeptide (TPR) repeat protein
VLRESLNQPLMVIFEDLHWIDEQTQELLNLLADSIGTAKVLLLTNYRPEYSHLWHSKTYYTDGMIDDALITIEEALRRSLEELVFRPNALNFRGELRLKLGQTELAEADFREAIALAQKMRAKAWELRATMSLARLLASQNRRDEALTMLAAIYNWFTEGFDTADLKDAKALIDELSC